VIGKTLIRTIAAEGERQRQAQLRLLQNLEDRDSAQINTPGGGCRRKENRRKPALHTRNQANQPVAKTMHRAINRLK
jgi:N-methylhydantoinase B/oxoprolinase/acetone carboxylase alpha subunit